MAGYCAARPGDGSSTSCHGGHGATRAASKSCLAVPSGLAWLVLVGRRISDAVQALRGRGRAGPAFSGTPRCSAATGRAGGLVMVAVRTHGQAMAVD